jgi:hypothetical protein
MIFLFGVRFTNTQYYKLDNHICPYCGNQDTLFGETKSKYFHIFFIPFLSLGKSTVLTCSHCLKKFETKQLLEPLKHEIELRESILVKSPAWQSCGCIIVLLVALFFAVATCGHFVFGDGSNKTEEELQDEPYEKLYNADTAKVTANPTQATDSIAFAVKSYIDYIVTNEMDKKDFKYFTKIKDNKLLVIVKVPDMKKVAAEDRNTFLSLIRESLNDVGAAQHKQLYISIEGRWNTVLVATPTHTDYNGRFADTKYLYDFYKPQLIKNNAVKDSIYDTEIK